MAQFTPTRWKSNTAAQDGVAYDDPATQYSSSNTRYSSATASLDDTGKTPTAWTGNTRNPTTWRSNPSAEANRYTYDSASNKYDSSAQTYDGIVAGDTDDTDRVATQWSGL